MVLRGPASAWSLTCLFFFNDTATTEIYTLSLHDALPISVAPRCRACGGGWGGRRARTWPAPPRRCGRAPRRRGPRARAPAWRSEEHTSELQSQSNVVCRLLLEKKKKTGGGGNARRRRSAS